MTNKPSITVEMGNSAALRTVKLFGDAVTTRPSRTTRTTAYRTGQVTHRLVTIPLEMGPAISAWLGTQGQNRVAYAVKIREQIDALPPQLEAK